MPQFCNAAFYKIKHCSLLCKMKNCDIAKLRCLKYNDILGRLQHCDIAKLQCIKYNEWICKLRHCDASNTMLHFADWNIAIMWSCNASDPKLYFANCNIAIMRNCDASNTMLDFVRRNIRGFHYTVVRRHFRKFIKFGRERAITKFCHFCVDPLEIFLTCSKNLKKNGGGLTNEILWLR